MEKKTDSSYQPLFDHMHQEHGLTLLESEMADIINKVRKMDADRNPANDQKEYELVFIPCAENDPRAVGGYTSYDGFSLCPVREGHVPVIEKGAIWVKAIERNPPINVRLHLKIQGVNHVGYWDAPANCYKTFLDNTYPPVDVEWLDESATPTKGISNLLQKISLSDIDAPAFTHTPQFQEHFDYIERKLIEIIRTGSAPKESDAVEFMNWTLHDQCIYYPSDEDQWTQTDTGENITSAELYELFIKQKEVRP